MKDLFEVVSNPLFFYKLGAVGIIVVVIVIAILLFGVK